MNLGGEKNKKIETRAEAIVPTTNAPYDPLNRIATITNKKRSRDASAYLLRSNFHLTNAILKNTAIPTIKNSILLLIVKILEHSEECSDISTYVL